MSLFLAKNIAPESCCWSENNFKKKRHCMQLNVKPKKTNIICNPYLFNIKNIENCMFYPGNEICNIKDYPHFFKQHPPPPPLFFLLSKKAMVVIFYKKNHIKYPWKFLKLSEKTAHACYWKYPYNVILVSEKIQFCPLFVFCKNAKYAFFNDIFITAL